MLQAKQAQLQNSISQLQQKLNSISQDSAADISKVSKEAQDSLGEALEYMEQFQEKMEELHYQPQEYDNKSKQAIELMDSASEKLDSADNAIEKGLQGSEENQLAKKLKEQAGQLAVDAANLDSGLTELEKEQMLARLEAANRLLESMAKAHRENVDGGGNGNTSSSHVLTEGGSIVRDTVREISRELWSRAFELEKRQEKPIEEEPSDARFFEYDNDFFEKAAEYNSGVDKK